MAFMLQVCRAWGRHYSSVSCMWTSFLKCVVYLGSILEAFPILDVLIQVCRLLWRQSWRVSHLDVIIRACLVCGRHSWSKSLISAACLNRFLFGRHYSSLSRTSTSILTLVPFGRHYSSMSRMWRSFLKYVAYSGSILEPFLVWTSLFKFVAHLDIILEVYRLFGLHYWTVSHLDIIIQVCRAFRPYSWSVSRHAKEWKRLTNFVHRGIYYTFTSIPVFVCVFYANEREGGKDLSNTREGVLKIRIPWEYIFSLLLNGHWHTTFYNTWCTYKY
jgi:hypothetical protein